MAYSVSPSGLMRWNVEITWRCSMGRVFDFNMSRLCPAAAAVLPRSAPGARCGPRAGDPAGAIPDKRYTALSAFICYFAVPSSDTDFGFSAFPGTRVATVGVFPARAVARTPHYVYDASVPIDRAAGTRGHARTHR